MSTRISASLLYMVSGSTEFGRTTVFEDSILPVLEAGLTDEIGADGGEYLPGIRFHPTPGHSVGHMSIEIQSTGERALFSGDVWHRPIQVYRPNWSSVFCADKTQAVRSRQWVLEHAAPTGAACSCLTPQALPPVMSTPRMAASRGGLGSRHRYDSHGRWQRDRSVREARRAGQGLACGEATNARREL